MKVLVTYGSKRGGTKELAGAIGDELRRTGLDVTVADAATRPDPARFDAFVVGGSLYALRWHRDARRFLRSHTGELRGKPVWLFSSGPLDDSTHTAQPPPVKQVQKLMDRVGARGHMTFGGRLAPDAKGFPASAMAKKNAGDWRSWDDVRRWADEVAVSLGARVG